MREEVRKALLTDWLEESRGYKDHVTSIIAMNLTREEKEGLCRLLDEHTKDVLVEAFTGVMKWQPDPVYRDALVRALDHPEKAYYSTSALIEGEYEGALECVFERIERLDIMWDALVEVIVTQYERLTGPMQDTLLRMFVRHFRKTPRLDWNRASWFRMLALLDHTDEPAAATLRRIWGEVSRFDTQNRYLLLVAMAGNPHPLYEPIFRKMAKSKVAEMRDMAREGLAILGK